MIVDAQGRTLYRFTAEAQGVPVCTGACVGDLAARRWPAPPPGLPKHVATVKRPDGGKLQLTYDGHPLYRYAGDQSKADANGEGVGGQWFVVKAGGASSRQPSGRQEQLRLLMSTCIYAIWRKCYIRAVAAPPSCAPHADAPTHPGAARRACGPSQAEVARLERAGSNPTAARSNACCEPPATGSSSGASTPSTRRQLRERLALTPAERLAAFEASQQNLMRLTRGRAVSAPPTLSSIPPACSAHSWTRRVDFVAIGGVAAVLHGSARNTFDLDICFASDPHNLEALGSALVGLHARLRGVPERVPFVPDAAALKRVEVLTLATDGRRPGLVACALGRPTLRRAARARRSLRRRRIRGPRRLASRTSSP